MVQLDGKFHNQCRVQGAIECQLVLIFLPEDGLSPELYIRCHRKERLTEKANKQHTKTISLLAVYYVWYNLIAPELPAKTAEKNNKQGVGGGGNGQSTFYQPGPVILMLKLKIKILAQAIVVSSAAVIRVVTQRFSPTSGENRCVTTLITAVKETKAIAHQRMFK